MTADKTEMKLGRFNHHPDPAIDFCIEVEVIEAEWLNIRHGFTNGTPLQSEIVERLAKAMQFRVGGDPQAVAAKDILRRIEKETTELSAPAVSDETGRDAILAEQWDILIHKDDRTSPEEYPDHCLITMEEVGDIIDATLSAAPVDGHFSKLQALWLALDGGPQPRCRDCADHDGKCPNDHDLPCDPQERALEQIKKLRAAPVAQEPVASAREQFCERCNGKILEGQNVFTTKTGLVHLPCPPAIPAGAILETLREHHNWHLQSGTIGLQDGDGGWVEIDNGAEYSDSALYDRTVKLLEGAPPEELEPMPRGGMNVWWWGEAILLRRKVRALEKAGLTAPIHASEKPKYLSDDWKTVEQQIATASGDRLLELFRDYLVMSSRPGNDLAPLYISRIDTILSAPETT